MSTVSERDPLHEAAAGDAAADLQPSAVGPSPGKQGGLFRAFWRWHFYASILVVPIMFMMAASGLVILYKWQIDPALHPGVMVVDVPAHSAPKPLSAQEAAVTAAFPDAKITAVQQGAEDRATFFTVSQGEEVTRNVYVDPYTARMTGTIDPDSLLSNIATVIHGHIVFGKVSDFLIGTDPLAKFTARDELTIGDIGDRIIELATCWALVMTLTGYYLFVRGRAARLRRVASGAKAAVLRNNHARFGALLGIGFLLLVASGLPWTGLWGTTVQNFATGQGSNLWGDDPGAESTLGPRLEAIGSNSNPAPWAEGAGAVPNSGAPAAGTSAVGIDRAVSAAVVDGAVGPFYVAYPDGEKGVYSVLADKWHDKATPAYSDVSKERTVHVDQYSGQVIGRYGYSDYHLPAKWVSQGIALHEGQRLGSFNLVTTTAFCLGVVFLCVSGPLMWWKRRPKGGGFAAPRGRLPVRATPGLFAVLVLLALFLPLFGASLLLVAVIDQLVLPRVPKLAAALNRTA